MNHSAAFVIDETLPDAPGSKTRRPDQDDSRSVPDELSSGTVDLGSADNFEFRTVTRPAPETATTTRDVKIIILGDGDDDVTAEGEGIFAVVFGGDGNDTLTLVEYYNDLSTSGALFGGAGDDVLTYELSQRSDSENAPATAYLHGGDGADNFVIDIGYTLNGGESGNAADVAKGAPMIGDYDFSEGDVITVLAQWSYDGGRSWLLVDGFETHYNEEEDVTALIALADTRLYDPSDSIVAAFIDGEHDLSQIHFVDGTSEYL